MLKAIVSDLLPLKPNSNHNPKDMHGVPMTFHDCSLPLLVSNAEKSTFETKKTSLKAFGIRIRTLKGRQAATDCEACEEQQSKLKEQMLEGRVPRRFATG